MNKIKVFLVDDHSILKDCLAEYIDSQADMKVVGTAGDIAETQRCLKTVQVDVLLLDLTLGERSGFEIFEPLHSSASSPKVLILTMHNDRNLIRRAMEKGARGYVLKQDPTEHLLEGIRQVFQGKSYLSGEVTQALFASPEKKGCMDNPPLDLLSHRELEVLDLFGKGFRMSEIAEKLSVSPKTIGSHRENLKRKLGFSSTNQLIAFASRRAQLG